MTRAGGRVRAVDGSVPLARLFAVAYRQLVLDLHTELEHRGWTDLRPATGFTLLTLREGPLTGVDLATVLGMTKQATAKLVDEMVSSGYVERSTGSHDARLRPIALTDRGRKLLAAAEEIYADLESRWASRIGEDHLAVLRNDLVSVLSQENGELPPVRPLW